METCSIWIESRHLIENKKAPKKNRQKNIHQTDSMKGQKRRKRSIHTAGDTYYYQSNLDK